MPSFASMPSAVPACEMASSAYSTWYRRPSGEKMVVWLHVSLRSLMPSHAALTLESYLLDMMAQTTEGGCGG
jgi:hypothetical protein